MNAPPVLETLETTTFDIPLDPEGIPREELAWFEDPFADHGLPIRECRSLLRRSDGSVVVRVESVHRRLTLDKEWITTTTVAAETSWRRHPSGRVERTVFSSDGHHHITHCHSWSMVEEADRAARPLIGPAASAKRCLPLAGAYGLVLDQGLPQRFVAAFDGAHTPAQLSNALFGEENHRKDLVRQVATATAPVLQLAWILFDSRPPALSTTPVDWLVAFLRINQDAPLHHIGRNAAALLEGLDAPSRRRLLRRVLSRSDASALALCVFQGTDRIEGLVPLLASLQNWGELRRTLVRHHVKDAIEAAQSHAVARQRRTAQQQEWLSTELGRTWQQAHDAAVQQRLDEAAQRTAAEVEAERATIGSIAGTLAGSGMAPYRIAIAHSAAELQQWGQRMKNCIGNSGYVAMMEKGSAVLLAIMEGDEMLACGDIRIGKDGPFIQQLAGYDNSHMPELKERLQHELERAIAIAEREALAREKMEEEVPWDPFAELLAILAMREEAQQ